MTVRKDDSVPVRFIELELEVPGTPEQVWQAIATGPGFAAWFVPTDVEEREGGAVTFHLAPGIDSAGVVTVWKPPHRFVGEEREWMPGAPPVATEILVEARTGGICRVRLVNSLFTSQADWDDQLESFEKGWPGFLEVLRLYLTHFPGQRCAPVRLMNPTAMDEAGAWAHLLDSLGLAGAAPGERRATSGFGAPALAGVVESVKDRLLLLRSHEPAPGLMVLGIGDMGPPLGMTVWLSFYLYGDGAAAAAEQVEPAWQAWLSERFAAGGGGGEG